MKQAQRQVRVVVKNDSSTSPLFYLATTIVCAVLTIVLTKVL